MVTSLEHCEEQIIAHKYNILYKLNARTHHHKQLVTCTSIPRKNVHMSWGEECASRVRAVVDMYHV